MNLPSLQQPYQRSLLRSEWLCQLVSDASGLVNLFSERTPLKTMIGGDELRNALWEKIPPFVLAELKPFVVPPENGVLQMPSYFTLASRTRHLGRLAELI